MIFIFAQTHHRSTSYATANWWPPRAWTFVRDHRSLQGVRFINSDELHFLEGWPDVADMADQRALLAMALGSSYPAHPRITWLCVEDRDDYLPLFEAPVHDRELLEEWLLQ